MGKGKGKLKYFVCVVKKGSFILEIDNLGSWKALIALFLCTRKLPIRTAIFFKL
jgi:ribosomal protein L16/L10AE